MGKFDNVIIVSDIDGTFLDSKGKLVPRNLEAVDYFKRGGGHFTVATGREAFLVPPAIPDIASIVNAPIIGCNGAYLYDYAEDKYVCEVFLDDEAAFDLVKRVEEKFGDDETVGIRVSSDGVEYINRDLKRFSCFKQFVGRHVVTTLDKIPRGRWHKIAFECSPDVVERIRKYVYDTDCGKFAYMLACPDIFEVQSPLGTKGSMLSKLKAYLGNKDAVIYAIGDYENDEIMLRSADRSATPANGLDSLKSIPGISIVGTNDGGAIADLIELAEKEQAKK